MTEERPKNRKKKAGRRGRPPLGVVRVPVQLRLDAALVAAFDQLCLDSARTRNAEVSIALREYLERAGRWPPKPPAK